MYESRILEIERRLNLLARLLDDVLSKLTQAQQQQNAAWRQGWQPGGTGGRVYYCDAMVISAGGNVTGKTVYYLDGGAEQTISTNATIYNQAAVATVSTTGQTIFLGPNGDGTYLVLSQSCAA